jgi:hypothetical protein
MSSVSNILSILEKELNQVVNPLKIQIHNLETENKKLLSDLQLIIKERDKLVAEITQLKRERENTLMETSNELNKVVSYEVIDNLFTSHSEKNYLLLLSHFNQFIEENDSEKVHYILELFSHKPKPLLVNVQAVKGLIFTLYQQFIIKRNKENETADKIVESYLKLLNVLHTTEHKDFITHFLRENYTELLDSTLYINEPKTIIRLLMLLMEYDFEVELSEALTHIIEVEWGFLDFNVSKAEFCFFLWYAYLFNLDQELLDRTAESSKWLLETNSVFQLYTFVYDCINAKKLENKQKFNVLIGGFKQNQIFNKYETERIVKKVNDELDRLITREILSLPTYNNALHTVDSVRLEQLIKDLQLKKRDVLVPLYTNGTVNKPSGGYAQVTIYMTQSKKKKKKKNKALIAADVVEEIHKRNDPERIKFVKYVEPLSVSPVTVTTQNSSPFKWPSTELSENKDLKDSDQPMLNQNSELKKLGYQITGLTRARRWTILQNAVPSLGLKKVAYTIAYNIRLRKGQKNGLTKFSYAIGEWEHDLDRLKKIYYKKDFTWPSV